jgi:hypothetical protein
MSTVLESELSAANQRVDSGRLSGLQPAKIWISARPERNIWGRSRRGVSAICIRMGGAADNIKQLDQASSIHALECIHDFASSDFQLAPFRQLAPLLIAADTERAECCVPPAREDLDAAARS